MYIDVLVELKAKKLDKTFTYNVPSNLIDKIEIGKRVLVSFGKQVLEGFILSINNSSNFDYELKDIIDVIDDDRIINEEMLELGKYIQKKTLCTLISAYQTMLPSALKAKKNFFVNKKYDTYLTIIDDEIKNIDSAMEKINLLLQDSCEKESKYVKLFRTSGVLAGCLISVILA